MRILQLSGGLKAAAKFHALGGLWQIVMAVEPAAAFLSTLFELEGHGGAPSYSSGRPSSSSSYAALVICGGLRLNQARRFCAGRHAKALKSISNRGTPSRRSHAGGERSGRERMMKLVFFAAVAGILIFLPVGNTIYAQQFAGEYASDYAGRCIPCTAKCRECGFWKKSCIANCEARGDPLVRANQSCQVPRFSRCRLR